MVPAQECNKSSPTFSQFLSNLPAMNAFYKLIVGSCIALTLQACAVVAVADAAVTVVATGVQVTAKAVGAVASAVIPGD